MLKNIACSISVILLTCFALVSEARAQITITDAAEFLSMAVDRTHMPNGQRITHSLSRDARGSIEPINLVILGDFPDNEREWFSEQVSRVSHKVGFELTNDESRGSNYLILYGLPEDFDFLNEDAIYPGELNVLRYDNFGFLEQIHTENCSFLNHITFYKIRSTLVFIRSDISRESYVFCRNRAILYGFGLTGIVSGEISSSLNPDRSLHALETGLTDLDLVGAYIASNIFSGRPGRTNVSGLIPLWRSRFFEPLTPEIEIDFSLPD